jgi:hypothetical protein
MGDLADMTSIVLNFENQVNWELKTEGRIPRDSEERARVKRYQDWVVANGGIIHKCKVKFFNKFQVYLTATENI